MVGRKYINMKKPWKASLIQSLWPGGSRHPRPQGKILFYYPPARTYPPCRLTFRWPSDQASSRSTAEVLFGPSRRPHDNRRLCYRPRKSAFRRPSDRPPPDQRLLWISEGLTCLTDTFRYLSDAYVRPASAGGHASSFHCIGASPDSPSDVQDPSRYGDTCPVRISLPLPCTSLPRPLASPIISRQLSATSPPPWTYR